MCDDPIVEEVRKTRERLAGKFDFDPAAIFADLRQRQAKLGTRLVRRQRKKRIEGPRIPGRNSATSRSGR